MTYDHTQHDGILFSLDRMYEQRFHQRREGDGQEAQVQWIRMATLGEITIRLLDEGKEPEECR